MVAIRLRHPSGVSTIQVALDRNDFTVQDLQQEIYAATQILPSRQSLKAGYPPHTLTLIPELPIESLGLKPGEQIIVAELPGPSSPEPVPVPARQSSAMSATSTVSGPSGSSAPTSLTPTPPGNPDHVEIDNDDNSCLFSSIALLFRQNIDQAPEMRKSILGVLNVGNLSFYYFGQLLTGRDDRMVPEKYVATILKPSTWGGAIELTILATYFNTEIASIDVETGRIDHFTPPDGLSTGMRCIVLYSGIHYDAVTLAPMPEAPAEWHQTMFEAGSPDDQDPVMIAAGKLAGILRAKKAFTNTATFDLKCEICGKGLKGEKDARAHAEQTGHVRFGEF
ncbi:hypothetical protein H0H93_011696 [Arthromyces matolae]|nr:hypothetical protein H0H93_011696 [Arthromyces matolae]